MARSLVRTEVAALVARPGDPLAPRGSHSPGPADNPAAVYLASLAAGSRPAQASALRTIFGDDLAAVPWAQVLTYAQLQGARATLMEMKSKKTGSKLEPATINRMIFALKGVLKAAWKLNLISSDDYLKSSDISLVRGSRLPTGRMLTDEEIEKLVTTADDYAGPAAQRDAAILAAFVGGALRRVEVAGLQLNQFDGTSLTVIGKGNKERYVPIPAEAAAVIQRWIDRRGTAEGPLFVHILKLGKITTEGLSTSGVTFIIDSLLEKSSIANASTHDFRRTYISSRLAEGVDITTVSKLVGHANITTTARYDRRGDEVMRAVAKSVKFPKAKK